MKKLFAIALIISAASLLAENPRPTPPPCDCTGIGIPEQTAPKLVKRPTSSASQLSQLSFGQYILYKAELAWWLNVVIYS